MMGYIDIIVPLAITGAGVVTGRLFVFSNFVMSSLAELPNDKGMHAMQRINEDILNPIFFVFFYRVLASRLGKFGLEVAEEKTNLIRFSPVDWKASGPFEFLGFEFRWGVGRWRKPVIKRRTARKKYRAALANF